MKKMVSKLQEINNYKRKIFNKIILDQANNEELQTKAIEITTQKPLSEADETKFPVANGYLGFELPIRGSIVN